MGTLYILRIYDEHPCCRGHRWHRIGQLIDQLIEFPGRRRCRQQLVYWEILVFLPTLFSALTPCSYPGLGKDVISCRGAHMLEVDEPLKSFLLPKQNAKELDGSGKKIMV